MKIVENRGSLRTLSKLGQFPNQSNKPAKLSRFRTVAVHKSVVFLGQLVRHSLQTGRIIPDCESLDQLVWAETGNFTFKWILGHSD